MLWQFIQCYQREKNNVTTKDSALVSVSWNSTTLKIAFWTGLVIVTTVVLISEHQYIYIYIYIYFQQLFRWKAWTPTISCNFSRRCQSRQYLQSRRWFRKLTLFYKVFVTQTNHSIFESILCFNGIIYSKNKPEKLDFTFSI